MKKDLEKTIKELKKEYERNPSEYLEVKIRMWEKLLNVVLHMETVI